MSAPDGLSTHELVLETRDMLARHVTASHTTELDITRQLASRPTRGEVIKWFGGFAALGGLAAIFS